MWVLFAVKYFLGEKETQSEWALNENNLVAWRGFTGGKDFLKVRKLGTDTLE